MYNRKDGANTSKPSEEAQEEHEMQSKEAEAKMQEWKEIAQRLQQLSLDIPSLAQAVPQVEEMLERQGLKDAYEINKTGVRDDHAPVIRVECKIHKH